MNTAEHLLIEKILQLPLTRLAEVTDFVDFLGSRENDRTLVQVLLKLQQPASPPSGITMPTRCTTRCNSPQAHTAPDFATFPVIDWQAAGLLKPSFAKPVLTTLEQALAIRRMRNLSSCDQQFLRQMLAQILR